MKKEFPLKESEEYERKDEYTSSIADIFFWYFFSIYVSKAEKAKDADREYYSKKRCFWVGKEDRYEYQRHKASYHIFFLPRLKALRRENPPHKEIPYNREKYAHANRSSKTCLKAMLSIHVLRKANALICGIGRNFAGVSKVLRKSRNISKKIPREKNTEHSKCWEKKNFEEVARICLETNIGSNQERKKEKYIVTKSKYRCGLDLKIGKKYVDGTRDNKSCCEPKEGILMVELFERPIMASIARKKYKEYEQEDYSLFPKSEHVSIYSILTFEHGYQKSVHWKEKYKNS
jgi:hypothetical protein